LLIDSEKTIRKFYAAANAIYSPVKFASEMTVLYLFETFCLPLLSYSCEALNCSKQQLTQLNVCWNRAYRKVFHMNSWDSVKELQALCGRLDFRHIYTERKLIFFSKLSTSKNIVVQACYNNLEGPVSSVFYVVNLMWLLVRVVWVLLKIEWLLVFMVLLLLANRIC